MSATNKRGQGIDGSTIALGSQLEGVNEGRTADPFEVFFVARPCRPPHDDPAQPRRPVRPLEGRVRPRGTAALH